jgi:hypothetical protein
LVEADAAAAAVEVVHKSQLFARQLARQKTELFLFIKTGAVLLLNAMISTLQIQTTV